MYFVFSKVLLFLLFPLNWIIVLLLIAVFSKKKKLKGRCLITGLLLLILFSNAFLLRLFAKNWDVGQARVEKRKVYSVVIVLGGFSGDDKYGKGVFNESSHRLIKGLELKESGTASHILISSGNGNLQPGDFKEAAWTKGVLKEFHLPDSSILIEQNSRNTFENAAYSKKLLQQSLLKPPYLLVTSAWHMRRAQYIFKKEGMDVIPCPSGRVTADSKFSAVDYFMPDASALMTWNLYLKELAGLAAAHLK